MQQREKLYEDIKYFIVNVGWTHKIHIVYSDKLSFWGNFCQVVQVVSSSITASGIAAIILGKGSEWSPVNKIDNLNRDFFVLCHD